MKNNFSLLVLALALILTVTPCLAAYDLEVPADPWDEYRLQFKKYSQQLQKSYDRAFMNDYEGAVLEASKAIEILPDEGLAYAERAKCFRTLNNNKDAELDLRKALTLFDLAIQRYRPGSEKKSGKAGKLRKVSSAESARLVTALRYQRGEAYFLLEQYRQAKEDFNAACKGGSTVACARQQEVEQAEKRGTNWVPLSARQFYDRQRIKRPAGNLVNVWVRQEDLPRIASPAEQDIILQHLELECDSRTFRQLEAGAEAAAGKSVAASAQEGFGKPVTGSAINKLLIILCPATSLK
ncbi:MAG TPA: hypothetical protein VGJ93_13665 [Desulfuromonadaceae bacterium]|jgi:tetratricopeptide (TPR) repeat protein